MTRLEFKQLYIKTNGTDLGYRPAWLASKEYYMSLDYNKRSAPSQYIFAPLPTVTTAVPCPSYADMCGKTKQEGTNPMRNDITITNVPAETAQSDFDTTREYFISRLESLKYPKDRKLRDLFNLYVDNTPKTYKDLIDAIKGDKYTLDAKATDKVDAAVEENDEGYSPYVVFYGITWNGPQPDRKGYDTATKDTQSAYLLAMDTIMASPDAAGMLGAVTSFDTWLPATTAAQ